MIWCKIGRKKLLFITSDYTGNEKPTLLYYSAACKLFYKNNTCINWLSPDSLAILYKMLTNSHFYFSFLKFLINTYFLIFKKYRVPRGQGIRKFMQKVRGMSENFLNIWNGSGNFLLYYIPSESDYRCKWRNFELAILPI